MRSKIPEKSVRTKTVKVFRICKELQRNIEDVVEHQNKNMAINL